MKSLLILIGLSLFPLISFSQSIVGTWQMAKQSTCVEEEIKMDDDDSNDLVKEMKSMSGTTPQVLTLKDNNSGEESTRIISRKKTYNSKSFLYKHNGGTLYFLDKKSRTIIEGFTVEKLTADSLIISNAERACETKIFVRLR